MSRYREPTQETYFTMDTDALIAIRFSQSLTKLNMRGFILFFFFIPLRTGVTGCGRKCKTIATSFVLTCCVTTDARARSSNRPPTVPRVCVRTVVFVIAASSFWHCHRAGTPPQGHMTCYSFADCRGSPTAAAVFPSDKPLHASPLGMGDMD